MYATSLLVLFAAVLLIAGGAYMALAGATFAVFVPAAGSDAVHVGFAFGRIVALAVALLGLLAFLFGVVLALRWLAWA